MDKHTETVVTTFQDKHTKCKYRICCSGYIPQMCFNHTYASGDSWCKLNISSRVESCNTKGKRNIYPLRRNNK